MTASQMPRAARVAIAVTSLLTFPAWLVSLATAATEDLSLDGLEVSRRTVVAMSVSILPVMLSVVLIMLWPSRQAVRTIALIGLVGLTLTSVMLQREGSVPEMALFIVSVAAFGVILALSGYALGRSWAHDRGVPVA